jgi:DNA-binding PadR family transcriptional regulator
MYKDAWNGMYGYGWHGHRVRRGDISPLILQVLLEKPMHGYEIITKLEEKHHGLWRPSAGSVYPNLQMLEEQGLVVSKEADGKRIYELTADGKKRANNVDAERRDRWDERARMARHFIELKPTFIELMATLRRIAGEESEQKTNQAKQVLKEALEKLKDM